MLQTPPAVPGMREDEIDTPALLIDLDAFEDNLDRMMALLSPLGVKLRPHAKTHKSPIIAKRQMARGAVGVCVQKVAEAEVFAAEGVSDILVSNEIVGESKLARLCALSSSTNVAVCVDDAQQITWLEAAAAENGTRMRVLVEIDVGGARCGVPPGAAAVTLAKRIAASKHLEFAGLQAYQGSAQHRRTLAEREALIGVTIEGVRRTVEMLSEQRIACPIIGGAGTGTFEMEATSGAFTEIQAGSYIFMDADYAKNLDASGKPVSTFRHALFVLSTVMSAPVRGRAVLDAGAKAISMDSGMPTIWDRPDITYVNFSDEHGKLNVASETAMPTLGEKLRVVPGHCDPTVDLHDWFVGVRGGRVECVWPVAARGGTH